MNLRTFTDLTIPHYLIITVFSTFSAALIINNGIPLEVLPLTIAVISLSFALLGFNTLNMIHDSELDKINKPDRPIPSGKVSVKEAKYLSLSMFTCSIISAFFTEIMFLLPLCFFIVISTLYTIPQIHLKKFALSSPLIGATLYGVTPFISAWSVYGHQQFPWVFFVFFSGLIFSIGATKDIEDIKGEKEHRISSIPIKVGVKKTLYLVLSCIFLLLLSMLALSFKGVINPKFLYSTLISFLLFFFLVKTFLKELRRQKEENVVTQSKTVTISMLTIVLMQLIYGLTTVII